MVNPIKGFVNTVRSGAQQVANVANKTADAVGTAASAVKNTAVAGGRAVGQAVDAFENKAASGARAVKGFFGGGHQPDRAFDGHYVGARGQTFPPGTPLRDVPGVTPVNNSNPDKTVLYVNGINTTKDTQFGSLQTIADKTGAKVIGIHNATEGMGADLAQCVKDKLDKGHNPAVDTLADTLYTELKAGREVHLLAHSQGGLITSRALNDVKNRLRLEDGMSKADAEKLMSNLKVETFGAAATRYTDGPQYVHYVNNADPVPGLFGLGPSGVESTPLTHGGRGATVHHFTDAHLNPIDSHNFDTTYMNQRVPFEDARAGRF
jgi:hypothetical protein